MKVFCWFMVATVCNTFVSFLLDMPWVDATGVTALGMCAGILGTALVENEQSR